MTGLPRVAAHARRLVVRLSALKPAQLLVLGFLSYAVIGVALLSLPVSQTKPTGFLDNMFTAVSAVSTTGLTTVSVSDSYTFFGELVVLGLFQLGGIGYMTASSFVLLARGRTLSDARLGVLKTEFVLPDGLNIQVFVRQVVAYTVVLEAAGAAVLYAEFRAAGVADPVWSAVFHSVSAFATAGFSLNNNSLEDFSGNGVVCGTVGVLSYMGALGFIVLQDAWRSARHRAHRVTFTTRVILVFTAAVFAAGTPALYFLDDSLQNLARAERFYAAAFQVMTASTTAGFNTVPIGGMALASVALLIAVMVIGASPSGTGGGVKTTTVSALTAILFSILRGRSRVLFWGHEIPLTRLLTAAAAATLYLTRLAAGVFGLCMVESYDFLKLSFEAASALGTVGLSLGITGDLTASGKVIVIALMFVGRVGAVTIGLAFFHRLNHPTGNVTADLAV